MKKYITLLIFLMAGNHSVYCKMVIIYCLRFSTHLLLFINILNILFSFHCIYLYDSCLLLKAMYFIPIYVYKLSITFPKNKMY